MLFVICYNIEIVLNLSAILSVVLNIYWQFQPVFKVIWYKDIRNIIYVSQKCIPLEFQIQNL